MQQTNRPARLLMRPSLAALVMVLGVQVATNAVAAAPNPARAADLRRQADAARKQAEGFVALAGKSQGDVVESATDAAAACRDVAAALDTLATAVGIGVSQEQTMEAATATLAQLQKRQTAAVERLTVRQAVAGLKPSAVEIESLTTSTPEARRPLLAALRAARNKAVAAGIAVHDAITPEADPLEIDLRRDDWMWAQGDLAIAARAVQDANERARLAMLPGADRPAAGARLEELAARDMEVLRALSAVQAATREERVADRKRAAAANAYAAATWATLTSLTLEQAKAWAALEKPPSMQTHDSEWNSLDALTTVSPEVAEVLAQPERRLSFDDLSALSPAEWSLLAKVRRLSLNGLTDLSPEVATALAMHPPIPRFGQADLQLGGLKRLSPQAADALSRHQGMVQLFALEELDSVPLARKLARQWGELRLGITRLSPEIAVELARHRGYEKTYPRMNYHGRADGAVSVLRLDNIESLSAETAEALAAHEGVLVLNGLTTLDPAVAAAFAKRKGNAKTNRPGTLVLNGLPTLSTEAAAALATFSGEIAVKAIREISPETATALAKHKGRLHLTGLVSISPEVSAILRAHPDVLLPRPPADADRRP